MSSPNRLRRDVANLSALAGRDLSAMWRQVTTAAQARSALEDLLPALIASYGLAAAALAADWYDEARDEVGAGGYYRADPADLSDPESEARSLLTWASGAATSLDTMPALILGGVHRRTANMARLTVMGSSIGDPKALGWQRVGNPECDFCSLLISRGAIYTESSAKFDAHDSCNCGAAPAWAA